MNMMSRPERLCMWDCTVVEVRRWKHFKTSPNITVLSLQEMCQYLIIWASLWTLSSMLRSLSSPSPVSPLVDLLPLSLGQGTLSQCQEGWQCWMTQWLHSTTTPWLWLGDLEDSTNVQCPTTDHLKLHQLWQHKVIGSVCKCNLAALI